jgi:hypothetical protein
MTLIKSYTRTGIAAQEQSRQPQTHSNSSSAKRFVLDRGSVSVLPALERRDMLLDDSRTRDAGAEDNLLTTQ